MYRTRYYATQNHQDMYIINYDGKERKEWEKKKRQGA